MHTSACIIVIVLVPLTTSTRQAKLFFPVLFTYSAVRSHRPTILQLINLSTTTDLQISLRLFVTCRSKYCILRIPYCFSFDFILFFILICICIAIASLSLSLSPYPPSPIDLSPAIDAIQPNFPGSLTSQNTSTPLSPSVSTATYCDLINNVSVLESSRLSHDFWLLLRQNTVYASKNVLL